MPVKINLRAARINAGLTQKQASKELTQIADKIITSRALYDYENHLKHVPSCYFDLFAKVYKMPVANINFNDWE